MERASPLHAILIGFLCFNFSREGVMQGVLWCLMGEIRLIVRGQERLVSSRKSVNLSITRRTTPGTGGASSKSLGLGHFIYLVGGLSVSMPIRPVRLIEELGSLFSCRTNGNILPACLRPSAGYQLHGLINLL